MGKFMNERMEKLEHLAYYDRLTDTYNFYRFQELAGEYLQADQGGTIAVLNVRQFKFINEIFGRDTGDQLLKAVAQVLTACQENEKLVCRESGDIFYLYFSQWDREKIRKQLEMLMEKISSASKRILKEFRASFYCGAVISRPDPPKEHYTLNQMLTHVMYALAKAKEYSGDKIWFFDAELHQKEIQENNVELHMHQALENGEFKLYLQPKVDLETHRLHSAEALVRWQLPDQRVLPPGQFIPIFERNGFCRRLDRYMLRQAGALLADWRDQGLEPVPISVNQSRKTMYEENYMGLLKEIKETCCIPDQYITLEILESMAFDNLAEANRLLGEMKNLGFKISMDDFGSGYSSLNVLAKLKIDELKIDQGFLRGMSPHGNEKMILEMIVKLSRQMHISTVAEGVETLEHDRLARSMGCCYGQGYLYSRPIPAGEFTEKYMKQGKDPFQFPV